MRGTIAIVAAALLLAGCGKGGGASGSASGGGSGGGVLAAGNWPAKDACKALDKAAVAKAVGKPILAVEPGDLSDDDHGTMAMCSWRYAEYLGAVTLMLRTAKDAGFDDSDIATARKDTTYATPWEDVPGLGKAALWNPTANSLQVFVNDDRYYTMAILKPPEGVDTKAALIGLAKSIG